MWTGHMTGLSSVDVKSIGAGGGSIAWIDSAGLLRVGPQSAGAVPGPACYGLGGTEPTVTDAAVVLGYINPDNFLGGRLKLDAAKAHDAVRAAVGDPLGMEVERAAYSILAVANEHMVTAIKDITINEGLDPRESIIVAGGGAGGMTIARIAEELGCNRVLAPRTAGALSATGGLFSDIVTEFSISRRADTNRFDFDSVNEGLEQLDAQIEEFFDRLDTAAAERHKQFFVEARYPYQVWELEVPLETARFGSEGDVDRMVEAFHDVHERVFAVKEPGQYLECIYWKGRATAALPKPRLPNAAANGAGPPVAHAVRRASFGADGAVETPVYLGPALLAGQRLGGPAIVEEPTTTVVVNPGWSLTVTASDDYLLEWEGSTA
jgi:N-methylhydantoinase A